MRGVEGPSQAWVNGALTDPEAGGGPCTLAGRYAGPGSKPTGIRYRMRSCEGDMDRTTDTSIPRVSAFVARRWLRNPGPLWLAASCVGVACIADVLVPLLTGRLVDAMALADRDAALRGVLANFAGMAGLAALSVAARQAALYAVIALTLRTMAGVASEGLASVQRQSTDWHAGTFSGSTVRKVTRGMWALDQLADTVVLECLGTLVVLCASVLLVGWRFPLVGGGLALGVAAFLATTALVTVRYTSPAFAEANAEDSRLGGFLSDVVGNDAVVKAFGAERREQDALRSRLATWRRVTERAWVRFAHSGALQASLLWASRIAFLGLGIASWHSGAASVGDVAYLLTAFTVVQGYMREFGGQVQRLQRGINEVSELADLASLRPGVGDAPGAVDIAVSAGEVRIEGVSFRYGAHATPLFEGLDLIVPAGQRVGLVGRSGSGKTSLVKLIQRLYDVTGGRILVDGQDIATVRQASLRAALAIVPQEPVLFHRTLAENIAYGRPDAAEGEIRRAAEMANADGFISRLPEGYATRVGERGVKLSGGERQRVALARAFLADAPVLILDEATSSLDAESEALVQEAMERLMRGRTCVVIAHRLSTVRSLDRIVVFDRGRIVEDGTHDVLMEVPGGSYRALFERQAHVLVD